MSQTSVLNASRLTTVIAKSLPKNTSPQLRNQYDAVALAVHACMISVGFTLIGLGEDDIVDVDSSSSDHAPLPPQWNQYPTIAFRYKHTQSAMTFIVKVGRLGTSATIDAVAIGADKRVSFDVPVNDFTSPSSFPATAFEGSDEGLPESPEVLEKVRGLFITPARLTDFASLVKVQIIQRIAPGIHKEGYEETRSTTDSHASSSSRQPPLHNPEAAPHPANQPYPNPYNPVAPGMIPRPGGPPIPAGERPPGFDDEYDLLRAPGRGTMPGMPRVPIGHDDLYPPGMGPNDPFRPTLGGPGGVGGGLRGGPPSGMYPTPDELLYGGEGGQGDPLADPHRPPGARYDPTFPGDPYGRGAGGRGPFGGYPGGDFI